MADTKRAIVLSAVNMKSTAIKPKKHKKMAGLDLALSMPYYPTLYVNTEQVPDLKGKEAGTEVTLVVQGKIMSHSIRENTTPDSKKVDQKECFDINILKIGLSK